MARKASIVLLNQDEFHVEDDCRSAAFEYEDWEAIEKITSLLWSNASLLGEFRLSDAIKSSLYVASKDIFEKLLEDTKAPLSCMEEQILALEAVVLTEEQDRTDESKLWDFIFEKLGYSNDGTQSASFQMLYARFRQVLKLTVNSHNRFFAEEGQKYYNTLKIHALAPTFSIEHLFNILYSFYAKNLESQYIEHDNSFIMLVNNISARWEEQNESDADLKLRSDTLASSFKMMFKYRPNYMSAVCDALTRKIDELLKGNGEELDLDNRWDFFLMKWFNEKTERERYQMVTDRKRASKERVITKKEDIHPQYSLNNEDIYLSIPRIRLPEITEQPTALLYQNDKMVKQTPVAVFGDYLCLTTTEFQFALSYCSKIDWLQPLNFSIKIVCGKQEIYNSGSALFRKTILFNSAGLEIKSCKRGMTKVYLFTDSHADIQIANEENCYQVGTAGQLFCVELSESQQVIANGIDVLSDNSSHDKASYFLSESSVEQVLIESGGIRYVVFDKAIAANVFLPKGEQAQNYVVNIDSAKHSLYEYKGANDKIVVPLPKSARYFHNVVLSRFSTGEVIFQIAYIILFDFKYEFDKPIYLNKNCTGKVKVRAGGNTKSISFELEQNQNEIELPIWPNTTFHLQVPKLDANLSGRNAFALPDQCWFDSFNVGDFIQLNYPAGFEVTLLLGSTEIPAVKKGRHYELGNYIHSKNAWTTPELPLGLIVRHFGRIVSQEFLTSVVFQPFFSESPLKVFGRLIVWDATDIFIGPADSEFKLLLDNDRGEPWNYHVELHGRKRSQIIERNFPCRDGVYHYQVFLRGKELLFKPTPDIMLWEGNISIGDPNISRFFRRELRLRNVSFWSADAEDSKSLPIRDGDGVLTELTFIGLSATDELEGEYPEYEGYLNFIAFDGRWIQFNYNEHSVDYELINPVKVWIVDEKKLIIQACSGDSLLVNTKRPQNIETVRLVNSCAGMTKEDQYKYLKVADYFEYDNLPATERY